MCVYSFCTIFTLLPFPHHHPPSSGTIPTPRKDLVHPPILQFCRIKKEKNDILLN
jgi:hypothetical protein